MASILLASAGSTLGGAIGGSTLGVPLVFDASVTTAAKITAKVIPMPSISLPWAVIVSGYNITRSLFRYAPNSILWKGLLM